MGIQGTAENLARTAGAGDDGREWIQRIKRCCMQTTTSIDACIRLARDQGNLDDSPQLVKVDQVVAEQFLLLRMIPQKRGILVRVH